MKKMDQNIVKIPIEVITKIATNFSNINTVMILHDEFDGDFMPDDYHYNNFIVYSMSDSEKIIKDEILYIDDVIPFKFRKNTILVGEFVFNNIICYYKGKPRCPKSDISVYILDSDISEYQKYLDENFAIKGRQILGPSTIFETVSGRKISVTPIGKNGTISNIFKMHPEYYNVAYFNKKFYEPKELNMAIRKFEIHVPRDYKPDMSYFTDVANLFKKNFNIYFHMKIHKDDNNVYKDFKLVFDYNNQLFANALKH